MNRTRNLILKGSSIISQSLTPHNFSYPYEFHITENGSLKHCVCKVSTMDIEHIIKIDCDIVSQSGNYALITTLKLDPIDKLDLEKTCSGYVVTNTEKNLR